MAIDNKDISTSEPITEDLVEETLRDLVPVFRLFRDQLQTGRGALGKLDKELETGDEDFTVATVFDRYLEVLNKDDGTELSDYIWQQEDFDKVVSALTDPTKRGILMAFYSIKPNTSWTIANGAINSVQSYKSEGFPSDRDVVQVFGRLQTSKGD